MDNAPNCSNCKHLITLDERVSDCQFRCITTEVRAGLIVGFGKIVTQKDNTMLISDPSSIICSVHEPNTSN